MVVVQDGKWVGIQEIEEKLGLKLEYDKWTEEISPLDYNNFMGDSLPHEALNPRSKEEVRKLLIESLNNGDIKKANLCGLILNQAEWSKNMYYQDIYAEAKFGKEESEQLQNAESEYIRKALEEIEQLDENCSIEDIDEKLEKIKLTDNACRHIDDETKKIIEEKGKELTAILQQKVQDKITSLDGQIAEAKEHLEYPENEARLAEIQDQVEMLEEKYYDDNARTSHKVTRIAEQGLEISEIMESISEYKIYGNRYMDDENFNKVNAQVAKKTEFLEAKLELLQKYKNIPGNIERIAQLETMIETMQDSWVVAQRGYNDIEGMLQTEETRKNDVQNRLTQARKEIETMAPTSREYLQKRNEIENLTLEQMNCQRSIERIQQTKAKIESGENTYFMGPHHIERVQRERAEKEAQTEAYEKARISTEQNVTAKTDGEEKTQVEKEVHSTVHEEARIQAEIDEERHIRIEQEWNQYLDVEELRAKKPDVGILIDDMKAEIFKADISGSYSSRTAELLELISQLPEDERAIVENEYTRFREMGSGKDIPLPDIKTKEIQPQEKEANSSVDLWMNRCKNCYSAMDSIDMDKKTDVITTINDKLKERTNTREVNSKKQETDER